MYNSICNISMIQELEYDKKKKVDMFIKVELI